MRLESVRDLKAELFETSSLAGAMAEAASLGNVPGGSVAAARRRRDAEAFRSLALGVARRERQQYHLAVRQQRRGAAVDAIVESIRRQARGEVDVRYVGPIVKLAPGPSSAAFYRARRRPLRIGASISDVSAEFITAGTLGCFVVARRAPHYISLLTNNHVIAGENAQSSGAPLVQQGTLDGGELADDQIGELGNYVRLRPAQINHVDAALGDLHEEIAIDPSRIGNLGMFRGLGDATQLGPRAQVYKVGRTTGQTRGRITAIEVDNVEVKYDLGWLRFDGQIEIEGAGRGAFSDEGDSGSLIVDEHLRGIGLLFAGGVAGGANGRGLTYANPLEAVLDALKVDLER